MFDGSKAQPQGGGTGVSVVIATVDGRHHLETILCALAEQTYPREHVELIVVDNGSTDGTAQFLRAHHPAVRVIPNTNNIGFAAACNQGAAQAQGRYLALLNNDMRPAPDWLERMVGALGASPPSVVCIASRIESWDGTRVDFAGGGISFNGMGYQDGHGAAVGSDGDPAPPERLLFPCGGAMLVDRGVFVDVGGFDERYFAFYEDVDFGWRLWVLGYEVGYCPTAVVYHRGGATGGRLPLHRKLVLLERNALYNVLKNYDDETLSTVWPAALMLAVRRVDVRAGMPRAAFGLSPARRDGLRGAVTTALDRVRSVRLRSRPSAPMPLDAYAGVLAIEDVVEHLPGLLETRRWIQERRQRSDREIFRLFPPRFVAESDHPVYRAAYRTVVSGLRVADAVGQE